MKTKIFTSIFLCVLYARSYSQTTIGLQAAIDTALKNNPSVINEKLIANYQKILKAASIDIPQTTLTSEYGQINSFYNDTKFAIAQSFSFPTVYAKQKSLQNENYKTSVFNIAVKEAELKKQVSLAYYTLIFLQQKKNILLQNDSLYEVFLQKANLRFAKGESNILEKTTAETQRGQLSIQLKQVQQDMELSQSVFQLLLNTTNVFFPLSVKTNINFTAPLDGNFFSQNPKIKVLQQEKNVSLINTKLQKSKLLPDLHFGYNNTSIQGTGADDVFYPKSTKFNSVQFGVGVPLFFGSQKAKINSSKLLEQISENNLKTGLQTLKNEFEMIYKRYETQLTIVKYFEKEALQNANTITKTANLQFANGNINYLEWMMLINNAISIKSNYTDALNNLNQTIIQLNYLTSN